MRMLARATWSTYLVLTFAVMPAIFALRYRASPFVIRPPTDRYTAVEWLFAGTLVAYTAWLWSPAEPAPWTLLGLWPGLALVAAATGLVLAGSASLGRSWRVGQDERDENATLVRGPLQRILKHPIYVGLIALAAGLLMLDAHPRSAALLTVTTAYCLVQARAEAAYWRARATLTADDA